MTLERKSGETVARILVKGWVDLRYFPVSLSPVFMETALFGSYNSDTVSAFLQYIPESERNILEAALQEFPADSDELVEILGEYDCKKMPSKANLPQIISEIGHKEIIQKPRFIADCMQPVLKFLRCSLTKTEQAAFLHRRSSPYCNSLQHAPQTSKLLGYISRGILDHLT